MAALSNSTLPGVQALVPALGAVNAGGVLLQFTGAGGRRYLGAALLPEAGWVLGVAAPAAAVEGAAAATRAEIQAAESRLLQRWGLALAAVLLAILLAGHWATRALTRPVSQLVAGTDRLAADLTYRLPPLGADELGDLARAFNRMAAALQDAHAQAVENARRAEEERQRALRARKVAVLEERNRLAREIHDTLAQGLTGIVLQLEAAEDALAAGEAAGAQPRLQWARELARDSLQEERRLRPDVVLMDLRLPVLDGVEATRRIVAECPGVRVLVLTTFDQDELILAGLRAGARGYLLKDSPREEIFRAITAVHRGEVVLHPAVAARVVERATGAGEAGPDPIPAAETGDPLSEREREVLRCLADGLANREIAARLQIAESTVKTHLANLFHKLGVGDRTEAVTTAIRRGWLRLR